MKTRLTFLLFLGFFYPSLCAQPGALDNTFGGDGTVTTTIGSMSSAAYTMLIQPDNKILVGGIANGLGYDFAVARYNDDGTLDISFSEDGFTIIEVFGDDELHSMAIQSDGKIILAGNNGSDYVLTRIFDSGGVDLSFGIAGRVITNFGSYYDTGQGVVIQSDGKIVIAGYYGDGPDNNFGLARYHTDGSLDTTFGGTGMVVTDFANIFDQANAIALQSDGKIVVAGESGGYGVANDFALARYNTDGSLDSTFSLDGKVKTDFGTIYDQANSVAIQSDGKIIAAGFNQGDFAIARYNSNGSLDPSFSLDGKQTTNVFSTGDYGNAVTVQPDGKIVFAGAAYTGSVYDFAVVRYNPDGSLDNGFGTAGILLTDFAVGSNDKGNAVVMQDGGKILVAGSANDNIFSNFAVARYHEGFIGIEQTGVLEIKITLFPNPSASFVTFMIENEELDMKNIALQIYDALGRVVYKKPMFAKTETVETNLPAGTYFYEIAKEHTPVARGKLIIQSN